MTSGYVVVLDPNRMPGFDPEVRAALLQIKGVQSVVSIEEYELLRNADSLAPDLLERAQKAGAL